jgi:hypothetical protein
MTIKSYWHGIPMPKININFKFKNMKKYKVTVHLFSADENGKKSSKNYDYTFQEKNTIDSRNNAISKVLELEEQFMNGEEDYDSFLLAQLKGFKNFNAYSINLMFVPNDDWEYCLYGEDEEQTIEALQAEVYHYAEEDEISLTEIEYTDGEWDWVDVIEDNIEFFIN